MATDRIKQTHTLSAAYGLRLLDLAGRLGVPDQEILEGFGLSRDDLAAPDRSLPIEVAIAMLERAYALTGDPALGIYLGIQMQASAHGILGYAAMTAGTVSEAIVISVRYMAIRTTAVSLRTQLGDDVATMILDEHTDLGGASQGYAFAILIGCWRVGSVFAGRPLHVTLDFAFPRPAYFDRFADALPETRFDQPANQLVLRDLSQLDAPLPMADKASLRLARDQCDELLQSMGLDGRIAPRVRSLLARREGDVPSLKEAAQALHLSSRTFRRRLEAEKVTFSAMVDEVRMQRALLLLRSRELTVEDVGERLGFTDVANFTRAFRRWTGTTPTAYRSGA